MISKATLILLTSHVLEEQAPNEVPLLPLYVEAIDERKETSEGPLGFGVSIDASVALLLPFVLVFFQKLMVDLVEELASHTSQAIGAAFRKLLSSKPSNADEARQQAIDATVVELSRLGMPTERVRTTSVAIVVAVIAHREQISGGE